MNEERMQKYIQELEEEIEQLKDTIWRLKQGNDIEEIKELRKVILNTCRILTDVTWDLSHT